MALKQAFEALKNVTADLTTLEVQSYTGSLTAEIKGTAGNILDWTKVVSEAKKVNGVVSLRLASHFEFDGDATLFASEGEIPADLRLAHNEAVAAGQQIRHDLFELFADTIKKLV